MEEDFEKAPGCSDKTTKLNNDEKIIKAKNKKYMSLPDISPSSSCGEIFYSLRSRPKRMVGKSTKDLKKIPQSSAKTKKDPLPEKKSKAKNTKYLLLPVISSPSSSKEDAVKSRRSLPKSKLRNSLENLKKVPHTLNKTRNYRTGGKERMAKNTKYIPLPDITPPSSDDEAFYDHQSLSKRKMGKSTKNDQKKILPYSASATKKDSVEGKEREAYNIKSIPPPDHSLSSDKDAFDDHQTPSKSPRKKSPKDVKKIPCSTPKTDKVVFEEKDGEADNTKNMSFPYVSSLSSKDNDSDGRQSSPKRKREKCIEEGLKGNPLFISETTKFQDDGARREVANLDLVPRDTSAHSSDQKDKGDNTNLPESKRRKNTREDVEEITVSKGNTEYITIDGQEIKVRAKTAKLVSHNIPEMSLYESDADVTPVDLCVDQLIREMERFRKLLDKDFNEALVDSDNNKGAPVGEVSCDSIDGSLYRIIVDQLGKEIEIFRKGFNNTDSDEPLVDSCTDHDTSKEEMSREDPGRSLGDSNIDVLVTELERLEKNDRGIDGSLDECNMDLLVRELERSERENEDEESTFEEGTEQFEHYITKMQRLLPVLKQELRLRKRRS